MQMAKLAPWQSGLKSFLTLLDSFGLFWLLDLASSQTAYAVVDNTIVETLKALFDRFCTCSLCRLLIWTHRSQSRYLLQFSSRFSLLGTQIAFMPGARHLPSTP